MLLFFLFACATSAPTDTAMDTAMDDTAADTADSGGGDTAPACAAVTPGDDWAWTGSCPGMTTPVAITVADCTLTLDYDAVGGMTMGMPYSATLDGDAVTFADDNGVDGCVGTVDTEDRISGSCEAGACTFKLRR